jgi:prephenate dehydrogenase
MGVLDEGFLDPAPALRDAGVVVLCVPVDRILPLAGSLSPFFKPGALVMDVGSVKAPIAHGAGKLFSSKDGPVFIGAHPMAGSEKAGVAYARADLYRGAVCVLTPSPGTPAGPIARAERFWRATGARPLRVDPAAHDRAVALVSHLPHVAADALILAAARGGKTPAQRKLIQALAAGSFRDATRVAGADPALWRAIFSMNDRPVRDALALFQGELSRLARGGWRLRDLSRARQLNNRFRKDNPS